MQKRRFATDILLSLQVETVMSELIVLGAVLGGAYFWRKSYAKPLPPKPKPRANPPQHMPASSDSTPQFASHQGQGLDPRRIHDGNFGSLELANPGYTTTTGGELYAAPKRVMNNPYVPQANTVDPLLDASATLANGVLLKSL